MENIAYLNLVKLNEGLYTHDGESLESAYVKITVGDSERRIPINDYKSCEDVWGLLESLGLDIENIEHLEFDPFIDHYIKLNLTDLD